MRRYPIGLDPDFEERLAELAAAKPRRLDPFQLLIEPFDPLQALTAAGAVMTGGHFVFTSEKHGSEYFDSDAIYPHTRLTRGLCLELARRFVNDEVEVVIAPAVGGVILSQWVAYHLTNLTGREILSIYAEPLDPTRLIIRRGYERLVIGKRVLVVDGVLTTGGSAKKTVSIVREYGGEVVGLGVICNRGGVTAHDVGDVPKLEALVNIAMDAWDEAECPLCAQGVPINISVGHGRQFLERKAREQKST